MTNVRRQCLIAALSTLLLVPLAAWGLISATLTPQHMVQHSEIILTAKVPGKDIGVKVELELVGTLKGKAPTRLSVDLGKAAAEHAKAARTQLSTFADQPVLLFATPQVGRAYLHVHGMWLKLGGGRNGNWDLEVADESMQATWAGGTDMLQRCVQYILSQGAGASVPVEAGTSWRAISKIGSIAGTARDIAAVDLVGDGKLCLFVASEKGDRLLKPAKDTFVDITEKVKLASKSRLAAWGDFNGDGRMSLASFDGQTLTLWTQNSDGSFSATKAGGSCTLPGDCVAMATIAVAGSNAPGLLLSPSSGPPVLLKPAGKNAFEALPPLPPAPAAPDRGKAQACLVADFDGDSLVDIIQPFEKGGLIYLGNKSGGFDTPKSCAVCCTAGGGQAALGDLDGDGLLDVLVAGAEGVRIFHNRGAGTFEESTSLCGEVAYKAQPFASWCGVGDFNNDSRRDLLITYSAQPMLLYFNRGFRSFGQAPKLEMALAEIPDSAAGQQMGLLADFSDGGAQDLVLVMNSGDIWCAYNDLGSDGAKCIQVMPAPKPSTPGPINVFLWKGTRCLGAAVVQPGRAPAFFGIQDAGSYTLKWRLPGGQEMSKTIPVTDKPVTVGI